MRPRSFIAFIALIAAGSTAALSKTPAEDPTSANAMIDSAFEAMAAVPPSGTLAGVSANAFAHVPVGIPASAPADTPARLQVERPAPTIVITVDKASQRMSVRVNGEQRWTWPVSTGQRGYATPRGTFKPLFMARNHKSREWNNAPMPHSIFFTNRGHAIHGSNATGRLGAPASHGCVRLAPANARQLFALVQQHGVANTTVVITGAEQAPNAYVRANATPKAQESSRSKTKAQTRPQPPRSVVAPAPRQRVASQPTSLAARPINLAP